METPPFFHNEAAASTAPAALKVFLLVKTTSTGYFHCMNFAQPVCTRSARAHPFIHSSASFLSLAFPFHHLPSCDGTERNGTREQGNGTPTPISALPAEILAGVRHEHHGQDELELLQRLLPFLLRVGFSFVVGGRGCVVAGGGVGEGVEVGGGGGGGRGEGAGGVDVLGGGGG